MQLGIFLAATAAILLPNLASAAEIKVLASGATKEAYVELVQEFEKSSGHLVVTTWTGLTFRTFGEAITRNYRGGDWRVQGRTR